MARAEILMNSNPDSSISILKKIDKEELRSSHDKALYALLYSQALDKIYIDLTTDSVIAPAVDYYTIRANYNRKAQTYYYLGRVYYNAKEIESAVEAFLEAKEAAMRTDNLFLSGQICSILGKLYYDQQLFTEAADSYNNSAIFFKNANKQKRYANALSYTAKCYDLLGKDSLMIDYSKRAIAIYSNINESAMLVNNIGSIAYKYLNSDMADSAVNYLRWAYKEYCNDTIPYRHYPIWCKIYFNGNMFEKAEFYGEKSLQLLKDNTIELGVLQILKEIALLRRELDKVKKYDFEYSQIYHKILKENNRQNLLEIEARYSKEKLKELYYRLESKHHITLTWFILLFTITLICGIYGYTLFKGREKRLLQKYNSDIRTLEMLNSNLQKHLCSIEKHNSILAEKQMNYESEILSALRSRVDFIKDLLDIAYITNNHPEKFYNKFHEYTLRFNNSSFADIIYITNYTYNGIIDHLKSKNPTLTDKEILYCCFIYLGFSPNAIRVLNGHTNSVSTYNTRSRINKKLGNNNLKLESYLMNIKKEITTIS